MSEVVVVGGGAAGMMAAIAAAQKGHSVRLYDKNEKLGKKIYITGKGRCNVTNACETDELFDHVVSNPKFLYSAFYDFDNHKVMDFFEERGCRLKTERGKRVFPVSDHSSDIIRTLSGELERCGVQVSLRSPVKSVLTRTEESGKRSVEGIALADGRRIPADAVILCCGGLSYQATGSTGDGLRMAREAGHSIVPCAPSLVPFVVEEDWCPQLQGLALKNVSASLYIEGKRKYEGFGELLFTHFGVSGPLILSASSYYQSAAMGKRKGPGPLEAVLRLDLKPALSLDMLDKRLLRDFEANCRKQFANALDGLFPSRLIPVMIRLSGIRPDKKACDITREERRAFGACIKGLELHVTGTRGYEEAVITRGGVKVKEVNPSTMESRLVSGLYMAGEMLDLDALTGGFNLQIAWSTGHLAGESIP